MSKKVFTLAIAGTVVGFLTASSFFGTTRGNAVAVEQVAVAEIEVRSDRLPVPASHAASAPVEVLQDGVRRTADGIRIVGPVFLPED